MKVHLKTNPSKGKTGIFLSQRFFCWFVVPSIFFICFYFVIYLYLSLTFVCFFECFRHFQNEFHLWYCCNLKKNLKNGSHNGFTEWFDIFDNVEYEKPNKIWREKIKTFTFARMYNFNAIFLDRSIDRLFIGIFYSKGTYKKAENPWKPQPVEYSNHRR